MSAKKSAFAGLVDVLDINPDLAKDAEFIDLDPNEVEIIEILTQEREEFEDEDNTLLDLGKSLKKRQLQPIVVRQGKGRPYELVAGERRVRAARLVALTKLKAWYVQMTDEEAADARLAENIQRKNLTQLEEARRLKRDVDDLGMKAAMEKHHKSQAWFSKRLALLTLPPQASRLVTEKISADAEVINQVATIEKRDPAAAAAIVTDLKATRGKENAREKVAAVKAQVKPTPKNNAKAKQLAKPTAKAPAGWKPEQIAGKKAPPQSTAPAIFPPSVVLTRAYVSIFERGMTPKKAIASLSDTERQDVIGWLEPFFLAGADASDTAATVAKNLRTGIFATDNEGWFAFAAFLEGAAGEPAFDLETIFGSAKA